MPRCIRPWLAWLLPALLVLLAQPALAAAAPRLALVVGNAAYPARPLATAANDAALVAQALAQAGFDVTAARDLDAAQLRATLATFVDAARAAGPEATLFVYFAGYGVQHAGGNFFVPVDARLVHDDDVPAEAASLDDFVRALAAMPAQARLVVADASRAHPFAVADEMPLAPGLGLVKAPKDTIIAFAAAPDMAEPDDPLPYGAYARALAETIAAPGVSANDLFDRVRLRVGELTNGEQVPWDDGTVSVALTPAVAPLPPAPAAGLSPETAYSVVVARDTLPSYAEFLRIVPDGPLAARIRVLQAVRREAMFWQAAAASDDPRAAWTYMRRYPRGPHKFDARRRLAALHAALEPPPRFDVFVFPALPPPAAAEPALVAAPEQALRGLPPIPVPPAALLPPADPAYYDELPMPALAPAGLLPVAPPLPGAAAGAPGRVTQTRPGREPAVAETQLAPNGSASVTYADAAGPILDLVASDAAGDKRTLVETGPELAAAAAGGAEAPAKNDPASAAKVAAAKPTKTGPPVLSRIEVLRRPAGVTIVQAGADGDTLLQIATRADADGSRVTRVTDKSETPIAGWRRDAQGLVVAREVAPIAGGARLTPAPIGGAQPAPPAPVLATAPRPPAPAPVIPPAPVAPMAPGAPSLAETPPTPAVPPPQPAPAVPPTTAPAAPPQLAPPPATPQAPSKPPEPPSATPLGSPPATPLPPRRPAALKLAATPKKPSAGSKRPSSGPKRAPATKKAPAAKKAPVAQHKSPAARKAPRPPRTRR